MDSILQDLRYAVRTLTKAPGFAAIAVITLALGIGANAAVFSVIDAALFRPLPFPDPNRLVVLEGASLGAPAGQPKSGLDITDWRAQGVFERVAGYQVGGMNLAGPDSPTRLVVAQATDNFFGTIGVRPALGREFTAAEGRPGGPDVVILSDGLWRRAFGADRRVLGRAVTLNGQIFTVVGVMPPGFRYPRRSDAWIPLVVPWDFRHVDMYHTAVNSVILARLARGVTPRQANQRVGAVQVAYRRDHPTPQSLGADVAVEPLRSNLVGSARTGLLVLFGAIGLILFIGCANVAGLLVARAASRQHEIALRAVLGATRRRVVRQLLTESAVLAVVGSAAGLLFAAWGLGVLTTLLPGALVDVVSVSLDARVFAFTLAVTLLAVVLAGLAPALGLSRADLHASLKAARSPGHSPRARRIRSALVVTEIALSLTLAVGAGLLLRSLAALQGVDPGFTPGGVLIFDVSLPHAGYPSSTSEREFFDRALSRISALPGVSAAGVVNAPPLARSSSVGFMFQVPGRPQASFSAGTDAVFAEHLVVSPGYFGALRVPVVRGRDFTDADRPGAPLATIINQAMAARVWPGENPVGRELLVNGTTWRVVGVVADLRDQALDERQAGMHNQMYTPFAQDPSAYMTFTVRAAVPPASLVPAVRGALAGVDPTLPVYGVRTLDDAVAASIGSERLTTRLIVLAGLLALVLAAIGVYGVMAHGVAQRTQEIGIRMALGAGRSSVVRLVLRDGVLLTAAGVALGLGGAWAASRLLTSLLYHVGATDPLVFVAAPLALIGTAGLAAWLPARRAARVDPMVALRTD